MSQLSEYDRYLLDEADKHCTDSRETIYTCDCCDEPIKEGDEYIEVAGNIYCLECVEHNEA